MTRTMYGRPVGDLLRGIGWGVAGIALAATTLLAIAQQLLANLHLRPVIAVAQIGAAVAWLALCAALAYLSVR